MTLRQTEAQESSYCMQFLSNQIYTLLTKCKVKMAEYWLSPFLHNFSVKTSGRSRHSDKGVGAVIQTLTKGGAWYQKKIFQPFAPQFGLKKRGEQPPPPPGSTTENTIKRMRPIYDILIQPSLINKGKKLFL